MTLPTNVRTSDEGHFMQVGAGRTCRSMSPPRGDQCVKGRIPRTSAITAKGTRRIYCTKVLPKPCNSAWANSTESAAIWLTGIGIGSRMPRERQSQDPPEFLAGTPVYMSPYARRFGSHRDYGIADTLVQFPRSDASDVIGQVASKYTWSLSCAR